MPDSSIAITAGSGTPIDTVTTPNGDHRQVVLATHDKGGYEGRASSFITPGRAGTTGQRLFAMHNATGSAVNVDVHKVTIDMYVTVVKGITVPPPIIRLWKITALPTGGAAVTKVAVDTSKTSSSSVTLFQDASADRTSAATALAATLPAGNIITQEVAPRFITAAGYEMADRMEFMAGDDEKITLRPLEGIVLFLDYTVATSNPITDMWVTSVAWEEYTP